MHPCTVAVRPLPGIDHNFRPHALGIRLTTYAELEQIVRGFARGDLNLLILLGGHGLGKSRILRQAMAGRACWIGWPAGCWYETLGESLRGRTPASASGTVDAALCCRLGAQASGLDWRRLLLSRCLSGKALLIAQLKANPSYGSEAERVKAFVASGGGSRATYFHLCKKLHGPTQHAPSIRLPCQAPPRPTADHDILGILRKWHGNFGNN